MTNMFFRPYNFWLVCCAFLLLNGCKKEPAAVQLSPANQWVLDSMKVYYYWKDQLPRNPQDQGSANQFFKSILNKEDRFSYLEDPDELNKAYSSFAWYGFEYAIVESNKASSGLIGIVTLVVPNGPADQAGLKRGVVFTAVDGLEVNSLQLARIHEQLRLGDGVVLATASISSSGLIEGPAIVLRYFRHGEMPVYLHKVFNNGTTKIGYIYYNSFNGNYDVQILETIRSLNEAGASELILDLRYNPGGDVSSAAKIAAVLTEVSQDQTFVVYKANSNGGRRVSSFQQTMNENAYLPQSFAQLLNYRMQLNRVVILTTGATASAAELLINNLKPYVNVIQIGAKTIGKDMASFAISDFSIPKKINLVLHPLVFKLYSAQGDGEYNNGLQPDYPVDEFSILPLRPFGDPEDPMLKKAMEILGAQNNRIDKSINNPAEKNVIKYESAVLRTRTKPGVQIPRSALH